MFRSSIRLQDIRKLLRSSAELELSAASIQRLKWFLYALTHEGNVSLTCRHFGISRSTFLRWVNRFDLKDLSTLSDESRRPKTVRKPETTSHVIKIIRTIREKEPLLGKEAITEKLRTEFAIGLSSSTVGRIITRHKLFFANTKAHTEKRFVPSAPELPIASPATGTSSVSSDEEDVSIYLPITGLTS